MAEHDIIINPDDFPSNAHKTKKELSKPKQEKVVTGEVKKTKPSFLKRAAEAIFSDVEEQDLKTQIVFDYLVPTIKDTVVDMGKMLLEAIFYGSTTTRRHSSGGGSKPYKVSYSSYYDNDKKSSSASRKTSYNFDEITMNSRGDAEQVLDTMIEISNEYGAASVGDFLDLVGIDNNFTDYKYGWYKGDLVKTTISRNHSGYIINFSKPTALDD